MLSDPTAPATQAEAMAAAGGAQTDVRELLARLQIGHAEAKHRAVDGLLDALRENEESVLSALGRGNVAALVQLLTATAPKVREKAATVLCLLAESGIPEEEETHGRSGSIIVISCCSTIRSIKILLVVSYGK